MDEFNERLAYSMTNAEARAPFLSLFCPQSLSRGITNESLNLMSFL